MLTTAMSQISNIAVDARTLTFQETGERGIGTYTICHLKAWAQLAPQIKFKLLVERGGSFVRGLDLLALPNVSLDYYTLSEKEFDGVDLFHVPDSMSMIEGYDSPFRMAPSGIRSSILFHDLIPIALKKSNFDRWHSNIQRAYNVRLDHVRESGAQILANSEATKRDLVSLAGVSADQIAVVLAGLSGGIPMTPPSEKIQETRSRLGINKPFVLVVGGLDEHKGFLHTLEACFEMIKNEKLQLVVVGSMIDPWKMQLKEAMLKKNITGVIFTGFVSDLELSCLYKEALALSFPSEYEGFGFPVLEAMAHGCPVICSDRASLPEIAGDAAIYLKTLEQKSVFDAIRTLISTPGLRDEMIQKGRQRAQGFTWEEVARKTIAALAA